MKRRNTHPSQEANLIRRKFIDIDKPTHIIIDKRISLGRKLKSVRPKRILLQQKENPLRTISKFEKRNLEAFVNAGLKAVHDEHIKELAKENKDIPKKDRKFKRVTIDDIGPDPKDRYRV